jgi:hypothetical protein
MNEERKEILKKISLEYFEEGNKLFLQEHYNSSVVLFFKSLASFTDLFLLNKKGIIPSSHNERFNITKKEFSEIYDLLDKDFPFYQGSYNSIISKEIVEVVRDDARIIAKKSGIKI